jgi:hypothetical protein
MDSSRVGGGVRSEEGKKERKSVEKTSGLAGRVQGSRRREASAHARVQ